MNQLHVFAPAGPSRQSSTGRPAFPSSLGRAATLNHSQHQRLAHTERGKLVGMCAPTLGVAKTGRFCGLGCARRSRFRLLPRMYDLLPRLGGGFGPRPFGQFDGIGLGCNRKPFANLIRNTADHPLHNAVEPFKRHFSAPAVYVPKRRPGAVGSAPIHPREFPKHQGERRHDCFV